LAPRTPIEPKRRRPRGQQGECPRVFDDSWDHVAADARDFRARSQEFRIVLKARTKFRFVANGGNRIARESNRGSEIAPECESLGKSLLSLKFYRRIGASATTRSKFFRNLRLRIAGCCRPIWKFARRIRFKMGNKAGASPQVATLSPRCHNSTSQRRLAL
jgi:hypothetical protein